MPVRSITREQYFDELSRTSEKYFVPYIEQHCTLGEGTRVLEVGCGVGGNLAPIAARGCEVTGIDIDANNIVAAKECFDAKGLKGSFVCQNFFEMDESVAGFDVVVCHDVIEHIADKESFLRKMKRLVGQDGIVFMSFPAWQMPFGGHHQNCRSRFVSHCPYIHLLPRGLYRWVLQRAGESESTVNELLEIKETRTPIELFERVSRKVEFKILDRCLYFINPHYETKFGLKPRRLWSFIAHIPWVRNFFTTSCFYIIH
ncbi:MAG: methyltransferase domain-containing protein [Bacteroidales bacterium]|nr:methyltransferase domain-containing protein [Bacteroidales bacterium]